MKVMHEHLYKIGNGCNWDRDESLCYENEVTVELANQYLEMAKDAGWSITSFKGGREVEVAIQTAWNELYLHTLFFE